MDNEAQAPIWSDLGRSSINDRWLLMRFITQGRQTDIGSSFRDWSPERTYRIRLQWGREGDDQAARLSINGQQIFVFDYPRPYVPVIHRIELGAAGGPRPRRSDLLERGDSERGRRSPALRSSTRTTRRKRAAPSPL